MKPALNAFIEAKENNTNYILSSLIAYPKLSRPNFQTKMNFRTINFPFV